MGKRRKGHIFDPSDLKETLLQGKWDERSTLSETKGRALGGVKRGCLSLGAPCGVAERAFLGSFLLRKEGRVWECHAALLGML